MFMILDLSTAFFSVYLMLLDFTFFAGLSVFIPWFVVNTVVLYELTNPYQADLNSPSSVSSVTSDDTDTTLPSGNL